MRLSVAMIVKNEEAMLAGCLDSVQGADEIVICDTGSTDKTVEIAKKYTDKVFTDYKWNDNFAEARNHAMTKCSGDWILTIDADDRLEPGGMEKIKEAIEKHKDLKSISVQYKALGGGGGHNIPVLYKKCKEIFWKGAIHNHLSIPAQEKSGAVIIYGHSPAHKNDPDRALRILKKEVEKDRTKPREMYYLAREYFYRKDWITAAYWFEQYVKISTWGQEKADAYLLLARCLWQLQRGEEARDICLQAIKINTNFREALLFMSEMVGPINKDKWLFMAELADNSNVLFTRGKGERDTSYYQQIYDQNPDGEARYREIYEWVGIMARHRKVLDMGCGQGKLSEFIEDYDGFDMIDGPFRKGDLYTENLEGYDMYILLEVLEHMERDKEILERIPSGKEVVFSVPSFDDAAHLRKYTEDIVRWRYKDLIRFEKIIRFNFCGKDRVWQEDFMATPSYILLCKGHKI